MDNIHESLITTLSSKGQMVVPRKLRKEMGLTAGAKLKMKLLQNGDLVISQERKTSIHDFIGCLAKYGKKTKDVRDYDKMIEKMFREEYKLDE